MKNEKIKCRPEKRFTFNALHGNMMKEIQIYNNIKEKEKNVDFSDERDLTFS